MSQRTKVVGARTPLIWLLVVVAIIAIVVIAVGGFVVYPRLADQRATEARLVEIKQHYQAGLTLESVDDWPAAEAEYKQVISQDASYMDVRTRLTEVKARQAEARATSTEEARATSTEEARTTTTAEAQATTTAEAQATTTAVAVASLVQSPPTSLPVQSETLSQSVMETPTPTPSPENTACSEWELASDFQVWPNQENPNRDSCGNLSVWHFMGSTGPDRTPSTYYLLPDFVEDHFGVVGLLRWRNLTTEYAGVTFNATGSTQNIRALSWPPNTVIVHSDPSSLVVIGWQSPLSGAVRITGSVVDADGGGGDGINWYISHGSTDLAAGAIDNGGAQQFQNGLGGESLSSVPVRKGEFIYLAIHPKENYLYDSTAIYLTITE